MRIWHQSITDISELPGYEERLQAAGEHAASQGTTIEVHGVLPGSYPPGVAPIEALRSPWAHHLLATQVVLGALRAREQGFDAVTISCFYDPGLEEARDASGLPVVSACETSVRTAAEMGGRAGLLALDTVQQRFLQGLAQRHGIEQYVACIHSLEPAVTEIDLSRSLSDPDLVQIVDTAAERAISAGASVIVPAEGVLNARLAALGVTRLHGVPVIDSFAALVTRSEELVGAGNEPGPFRNSRAFEESAATALRVWQNAR